MIGEPNEEAIPESQVVERNNQEHHRVYDPTNNALLQEILEELKDLNYTIKKINNMEI
jgi:DNA-binding transcriptional MerR regulator